MIRSAALAPAYTLPRPRIVGRADALVREVAWPLLLVLTLFGLISLLYLAQASGVATTGYDIQSLEIQRRQWEAKNEQVRARIAALESLDRIEHEAKSRLRMTDPARVVFIQADISRHSANDEARASTTSRSSSHEVLPARPTETVVDALMTLIEDAR